MATKKNPKPDQHKSGFMVRLPEHYRGALTELKKRTRRPITQEVQLALEAHLTAAGVVIPSG
jgi:hypothetical protein